MEKFKKSIPLFLVAVLLVLSLFMFFNSFILKYTTGRAFYFTSSGLLGVTEPGAPLPPEIANMNMVLWGIISALFFVSALILIIVGHRTEKHEKKHNTGTE